MWVEREFIRTLQVEGTSAAVDKLQTAKTSVEKFLGRFLEGVLVKEILEITYCGDIQVVPESQACAQAVMVVKFRASCMTVGPGDAMMLRLRGDETPQFANSVCIGTPENERVAALYKPGQLVPMIIKQVLATNGRSQAAAFIEPWLASVARSPVLVHPGAVSKEDLATLKSHQDELEKIRKSVDPAVLKLFSVGAKNKKALSLVDTARALQTAKTPQAIQLDLGHGGVIISKIKSETIPLEPFRGLEIMVLREYQMLSMAGEIEDSYPEAIDAPEQKAVWKIAQTT